MHFAPCLLCFISVPLLAQSGTKNWTAVHGQGYSIAADAGAGPSAAHKMARRLENFGQLLGGTGKTLPLRVLLLSSAGLFARLRPSSNSLAFYQSSPDADWIVVQWGHATSEHALSHELVHASLEHAGPRRPLWLEEGLAEFYSTARLHPNYWFIGEPIENHVRALGQYSWLGEREFFEATFDGPHRNEASREGLFYAQSWALVHYLLTSPGIREKTPDLFNALGGGLSFARAAESILDQRQGVLLEAARGAVERRQFRTARIAAGHATQPPPPAVKLSPEDTETLLGGIFLAVGQTYIPEVPSQSPAHRGLLALRAGRAAEAERLLAEAVAANVPEPAPYFELAILLRDSNREPERVAALLRQTIERNPNHAEAHFLLGLRAAAAGDDEGAIDYYQKAAQILPRQANFWHALALALERTNRLPEAAHAAMRCRLAARNSAEREMAAAIERLVREPAPPPNRARKPEVEVPASWQGLRGDSTAAGHLTDFDCGATPPLARIDTPTGRLNLRVERPKAIRISGTGTVQHTLACGPQKTAVAVEYRRQTNELTALEFR